MNEKFSYVFEVNKSGTIVGCTKIPHVQMGAILAELRKHCYILVGGKHYSTDRSTCFDLFCPNK